MTTRRYEHTRSHLSASFGCSVAMPLAAFRWGVHSRCDQHPRADLFVRSSLVFLLPV